VDSGKVIHNRKLKISYLPQEENLNPNSTIQEIKEEWILENLNSPKSDSDDKEDYEYRDLYSNVFRELGLPKETSRVGDLSGGQKKKLCLSHAILAPADFLFLDEPTNHLDLESIEWLENHLDSATRGLLLITHDRYFLDRVVDRIIEVDSGKVYFYDGAYETYLREKKFRKEEEARILHKNSRLYAKEWEWFQRQPKARGTKQKAREDRVLELEKRIQVKDPEKLEFTPSGRKLGKKILEWIHLSKSLGGQKLFGDLNHIFRRKERLGIVGPNGSGKSTLLKITMGEIKPDTGSAVLGVNSVVAYFGQNPLKFPDEKRIIDHAKELYGNFILLEDGRKYFTEDLLEIFLFSRDSQYQSISKLSGGEKRRLQLALELLKNPNILILDEPTNDLDLDTLGVLEEYIDDFPGTVLIVSHDRYFLDRCVDFLLVLDGEGNTENYPFQYTEYLEWKKAQSKKKKSEPVEKVLLQSKKKKKLSYKEERERIQLQESISSWEMELDALKNSLDDAKNDYQLYSSIGEKQSMLEEKLLEAWTRLEELQEGVEEK
jgi:ATP-binding cassette subfamily F protein uup